MVDYQSEHPPLFILTPPPPDLPRLQPDYVIPGLDLGLNTKLATLDGDNAPHLLPPILTNDTIPQSISAAHQAFKLEMSKVWEKRWAQSPHFACMENIDPSLPSRQYRTLTDILTRAQSSVITQLQMGHIPLHKHLYRIKKVTSPLCPTCSRGDESVHHFLFECHTHEHTRISLREVMGRNAKSLRHLLNTDKGIQAILHYMARTERLQPIYGDVTPAPSDWIRAKNSVSLQTEPILITHKNYQAATQIYPSHTQQPSLPLHIPLVYQQDLHYNQWQDCKGSTLQGFKGHNGRHNPTGVERFLTFLPAFSSPVVPVCSSGRTLTKPDHNIQNHTNKSRVTSFSWWDGKWLRGSWADGGDGLSSVHPSAVEDAGSWVTPWGRPTLFN